MTDDQRLAVRSPDGLVIPYGEDLAPAVERAAQAEVARLAAQLRALGHDPAN